MYIFFAPILFLPLLEIVGFVTIGARIGVVMTLLWLAGSTMLGIYLLKRGGSLAWRRTREGDDAIFMLQDAFDHLCLLVAALLLIFPGFISDFFAIPFLLAPFRHWLFGRAQENPDGFMRRSYRSWSSTRQSSVTIEGEFRRVDDTTKLPGSGTEGI